MTRKTRLLGLLLLLSPAGGAGAGEEADDAAARTPTPEQVARLTPGESSRAEVIDVLGEPVWEYDLYTEPGEMPVQLPETTPRYDPEGNRRRRLRVLQYRGDRRRSHYAAVLDEDVLQYTVGPVPASERTLEALEAEYGEPEISRSRMPHGHVVWTVEVLSYDDRGLAFIREPGQDTLSAKVRRPAD